MMGRTHAVSGAAVWLGAVTAVSPLTETSLHVVAAGTVLATAAALGPDLDHPHSTATRHLGRSVHKAVAGLAVWTHKWTRAALDKPATDGHRGLTHTLAFALLVGVIAGAVGAPVGFWWAGLPVALGWAVGAAGDALTRCGAPLLWPLTIRGRRWWDVCPPTHLRIHTNGPMERWVVYPACLAGAAGSGLLLVF